MHKEMNRQTYEWTNRQIDKKMIGQRDEDEQKNKQNAQK